MSRSTAIEGNSPADSTADSPAAGGAADEWEAPPDDLLGVGAELGRTAFAHLLLVRQLVQKRQYARALGELDAMLADNPALGVAHFLRGLIYGACGELPAARDATARAIEVGYARAIVWLLLGQLEVELSNFASAARCADETLKLDPRSAAGYELRGDVLAISNRRAEAAAAYEAAAKLNPQSRPVRLRWARQLELNGQNSAAEQVVLAALRLNPYDLHSRINLGNLLWAQGRFDEALVEFHRAGELKLDSNSRPQSALGRLYRQLGRNEEAEAALREAVRINSKDFDSFVALGELFLEQGKVSLAHEALTSAVAIDGGVARVRKLLEESQALTQPTHA